MPIYNLHSKRQKRLRGDVPDVYTYDDFPEGLRNQIVHIWRDVLGENEGAGYVYSAMGEVIAREYGLEKFTDVRLSGRSTTFDKFRYVFVSTGNFDLVLDMTELSFRAISSMGEGRSNFTDAQIASALDELNRRFQEHGVGYQFLNDEIIRIDSELLHSEVVKPALRLLNQPHFAGAQDEFLKAHEHYRKGNNKEAMTDCAKSLESVLKSICTRKRWAFDPTSQAKTLIAICFENGLIPAFWQTHFSSLRSMLESSVPTARNKVSAHGQGSTPTEVPDYLVAYVLHMTASTIVFLAEAEAA